MGHTFQRRVVTALALLFIVSSVFPAGALAHDATTVQSQQPTVQQPDGTVALQDGNTSNQSKKSVQVTTLINWLKVYHPEYKTLSQQDKDQIKKDFQKLQPGKLSKEKEKQRLGRISKLLGYKPPKDYYGVGGEQEASINRTISNVFFKKIGDYKPQERVPEKHDKAVHEPKFPGDVVTMRTMTRLGENFTVYVELSAADREKIRDRIRYLENFNQRFQGNDKKIDSKSYRLQIGKIGKPVVNGGVGGPTPHINSSSKGERSEVFKIVSDGVRPPPNRKRPNPYDIDLSWIVNGQLEALKDATINGFNWLFQEIYSRTIGTPVPKNDGWHNVLGEPTNEPFKTLYDALLIAKLYPVMNYLLGIGILFLGASLAVNPFLSRYRIWDLLTKFVAGLMFYSFGWTIVTLLHGVVSGITGFIMPNTGEVTQSAGTLLAVGSVPIIAGLAGALTSFAALFELGVTLGVRHFLLTFIFPYVLGPLLLILYISPWKRLRSYASMAIWQYINFLTMVIPIAIVLRAVVAVQWALGDVVGFIFTTIGLFLFMVAYPIASIYFFFRISGSIASRASTVSSQIKSAGQGIWSGGGGSGKTVDTGGNPDQPQPESMIEVYKADGGSSSANTTSQTTTTGETTTAEAVREANESDDPGGMTAAEMKSYVEQHPNMTTLKERLAQ